MIDCSFYTFRVRWINYLKRRVVATTIGHYCQACCNGGKKKKNTSKNYTHTNWIRNKTWFLWNNFRVGKRCVFFVQTVWCRKSSPSSRETFGNTRPFDDKSIYFCDFAFFLQKELFGISLRLRVHPPTQVPRVLLDVLRSFGSETDEVESNYIRFTFWHDFW